MKMSKIYLYHFVSDRPFVSSHERPSITNVTSNDANLIQGHGEEIRFAIEVVIHLFTIHVNVIGSHCKDCLLGADAKARASPHLHQNNFSLLFG